MLSTLWRQNTLWKWDGEAHIQFDQAKMKNTNPAGYLNDSSAATLTHLGRNKSLAQCFTVGKQDFRANTTINVSVKFIQYSATF